ncbi:MAG: alpha-amylase [Shackletoniella antarctica]|uniref:Alpha-amylase n=1 Tax=Shackletoniella antarctica TaxID=268115 RepID=A0A2W4W2M2_9CYAN|nr:MAG: alpha-amylase [Shackletoniella antarctica]
MAFQTPDWVKHAVFYQIFPDRFARTHRHLDNPAMAVTLEPWETPPTPFGYKGGDLWGIAEKLDYLVDLGVTAIYMTPIFQAACNHRYHTHDYYQVDPLLGGNEAFSALLEAAHAKDIKVVLDGVFNHCGRGFFFFNDILENGPSSPWLEWFEVEGWPLSAYDGSRPANYRSWVDNRALPAFKHDHPAVREYLMRVGEYWVRQGIDGWRLDVPYEVKTEGFWQEFRDRIKAINPEAYIVGEVWTDATQWLDGTQFDGVMNYLFAAPTIAFAGGDRVRMDQVEIPPYYPYPALDAAGYADKIEHLIQLYPWEIALTQLNLLSSHDVARLYSVVGEDQASVVLATLLLFTFPGAPSIYYGDEVGLPGELDPDCRRTFPPESEWHQDLLKIHRDLIALRHRYPALRTGTYEVLHAEGDVYIFRRLLGQAQVVVALNVGVEPVALGALALGQQVVAAEAPLSSVFTYRGATWDGEKLHLPSRAAIALTI